MIDLRSLRAALGGEIVNGRQLLCPGPGHSPRDRSLSVWLTADGFTVHSHAGDDWQTCKDYVRQCLGWPAWQPGDGGDRRVDPSRIKAFDRAAVDAESEPRPADAGRPRPDRARRRHMGGRRRSARHPGRDSICGPARSSSTDDVAVTVLRFHPRCPWRNEDTGRTVFIPALVAAFTSIDDGQVTAVHRIRVDQPHAGRRRNAACSASCTAPP